MTAGNNKIARERPIRIGTRRSPLALIQAELAADAIRAAHGLNANDVELVPMIASGDRVQDRPLHEIGGKALWTKELDRALDAGEIDCAVHSMKDVETIRPDHFWVAAMLERADVRDRLIGAETVAALKKGAVVGTASPRREAQLLRVRPDLQIVLIRGNVATRLGGVERGDVDATLLAAAGLDRLGKVDIGAAISVDDMLPAPSQGAVGIEILADNAAMRDILAPVDHRPTHICVQTERELLLALDADCQSPMAAFATLEGDRLYLRAEIMLANGTETVARSARYAISERDRPAILAREMLDEASAELRQLFGA